MACGEPQAISASRQPTGQRCSRARRWSSPAQPDGQLSAQNIRVCVEMLPGLPRDDCQHKVFSFFRGRRFIWDPGSITSRTHGSSCSAQLAAPQILRTAPRIRLISWSKRPWLSFGRGVDISWALDPLGTKRPEILRWGCSASPLQYVPFGACFGVHLSHNQNSVVTWAYPEFPQRPHPLTGIGPCYPPINQVLSVTHLDKGYLCTPPRCLKPYQRVRATSRCPQPHRMEAMTTELIPQRKAKRWTSCR